jgi:hypothetical protein
LSVVGCQLKKKKMKKIKQVLILFLVCFVYFVGNIYAQNVDKLGARCPSPNRQVYSSILATNTGNIIYTPCPNASNLYNGAFTLNATTSPFGLFWRPSFPQLSVFDIFTPSLLRQGVPYLAVGSNSLITQNRTTLFYAEGNIAGTTAFSSGYGIVTKVNMTTASGVNGGELYGGYFSISNNNDTSNNLSMTGVTGFVDAHASTNANMIGGLFESFKGGTGASTNLQIGVEGASFCGHNAFTADCVGGYFDTESLGGGSQTITKMSPVRITAILRGSTTLTDLRGIEFINWAKDVTDTATTSSAIYADTSVDSIGTTHYFINSLSTSPSRFAGNISITDNSKGIILKSPDNTCHLIAVSNANALSASTVSCP